MKTPEELTDLILEKVSGYINLRDTGMFDPDGEIWRDLEADIITIIEDNPPVKEILACIVDGPDDPVPCVLEDHNYTREDCDFSSSRHPKPVMDPHQCEFYKKVKVSVEEEDE